MKIRKQFAKKKKPLTTMRIPPKKPHFFKPLSPDFKRGVKIPKSFLKYLNGEKLEKGILRRGCGKWDVKINNQSFENGWAKFAEDNGLEVGDLLVFRHEGEMEFEIIVFDPTACEKDYPFEDEKQVHTREAVEFPLEKSVEADNISSSKDIIKKKAIISHSAVKKTSSTPYNDTYFLSTVMPYSIKNSVLYIPMKFAKLNGLNKRHCQMILRDENQRSWPVELGYNSFHVYIRHGLREFFTANGLKEGDAFILELIDKGKKPIMELYRGHDLQRKPVISYKGKEGSKKIIKGKAVLSNSEVQKTSFTLGDHNYFQSTLMPYSIKNSVLHIPMQFAKLNDLNNRHYCQMILRDQKQRSWPAELGCDSYHVYIRHGWREFCKANGLKEGDAFILKLIAKGKNPIMELHRGHNLKRKPVISFKAKTSTNPVHNNHPYFVSTVKPYNINKSMLYLPIKFVRSNLSRGDCKMIHRDQEQRSWPVEFRDYGMYACFGRGWSNFCVANYLKEGEAFKFELIKNGKKPIATIHRKFSGETSG